MGSSCQDLRPSSTSIASEALAVNPQLDFAFATLPIGKHDTAHKYAHARAPSPPGGLGPGGQGKQESRTHVVYIV